MRTYAKIYWKKELDNIFRLYGVCTICKKHFKNGNVFAASYCPECGKQIAREKTRDRVKKYREKIRKVSL